MPEPLNLAYAFTLPPALAVEYFQSKGYLVNAAGWAAVAAEAHKKSFTVARVGTVDILRDIRGMLDKGLQDGITFAEFQKTLTPKLRSRGWWGKDENGVQLGSPHRLSTIFRTNIQTSYIEGRKRAMLENVDDRPWWKYVAVRDSRTRPAHLKLNGKVFRYDDPFWTSHTPPLGFNCRCRIAALSDDNLAREGITPESGSGRMVYEDVQVQGHDQPQAGYRDPMTGETLKTDVGWGYNRDTGWRPDPAGYPQDLAPLVLDVAEEADIVGLLAYDKAIGDMIAANAVTAASSRETLIEWIDALRQAAPTAAVMTAITEAQNWLRESPP